MRQVGDRLKQLSEKAILAQRTRIGFVFQNFNLFPHLTVLDNVTAAPVATGHSGRTDADVPSTRRVLRCTPSILNSVKRVTFSRTPSPIDETRV